MKKILIIILLYSCQSDLDDLSNDLSPIINQDGTWHSNYYNLSFTSKDTTMVEMSYEKAYGGDFEFTYEFIEDSLRFDVIFIPDNNNYYTHTIMVFEWMYQADVHLGIIKGTIYYDNGDVVALYKGKHYIILEKQ